MEQSKTKKRGTFATKIIVMVILAVIVSNVICMVFILESSKKQITDSVKHTMVDVINTTSKITENEISNSGVDDLDYDGYANNLSDVKLEGIDSAYMYVVQKDGTMLYHPTKEKVGQPVENAVIKDVVKQLQDGKKPGTTVVEYDFNGTTKYSAYTILNNENILVLTADESEALAGIIANEMGTKIKVTSGPAIGKPGEMAAILNGLSEGDILFVDEIHRLNRQVEEVLYPAMEDYAIDIMIGKGESAKSIRFNLPKFTLVGATTRAGMLSAPLRDRFGVVNHMEFYTVDELKHIIVNSAKVLGVEIDDKGAYEMARRSRGTPRLANRLLKRVRDFAQVKYDGKITYDVASFALDLLEVDKYGLDLNDRNILLTIIDKFAGGPVGLDTLAAAIGEDAGTIEDVYEPYLVKNGFINRTPKGRVATELAFEHFERKRA